MIFVLAASLVTNLGLGSLIAAKLWHRREARRRPNDYSALGAERFGEVSPGRLGLYGDSQAQNAPMLEMTGTWRQYGIGGATIREVASWADQVRCEEVIVMAGTNDLLTGRPAGESARDAELLLARLAPRPVTWVAVPPVTGHDPRRLNEALRAVVKAHGGRWVSPAFGPGWTDDGVHFNRAAYLALAVELATHVDG